MWQNYRVIRNCYKYYSSIGIASDIWGMSNNTFTDWVNNMDLIDGKTLNLSGCDLEFEKTNYSDAKYKFNPKASLIRFNFMEIIGRMASIKFMNSGLANSWSESVKMMIDHCIKKMDRPEWNSNIWRENILWKERPDMLMKKYKHLLDNFFAKYNGAKTMPGKKKFMSLEEFKQLCSDGCLMEDESMLADRELSTCFCLSMQTQVDEINQCRNQEMSFIEFIEAFARAADKANLNPIHTPEGKVIFLFAKDKKSI